MGAITIVGQRPFRGLASGGLALIVAACASLAPDPTSVPSDSEPPSAEATMIVGVHIPDEAVLGHAFGLTATDLPLYSLHPNGSLWDAGVKRFVYSGVYRLDQSQSPVPDLAEEPCLVSGDLLVITCSLRDATFHDGTPVTADDVAFAYRQLISEACRLPMCGTPDVDRLAGAAALDDRTVEFRLSSPDPAFITATLPEVMIEPRARVELAFAEFLAASEGADPDAMRMIASRLEAAVTPADPVGCEPPDAALLAEAELAIADIGREVRSRDAYAVGPGGAFDACAFGEYVWRVLTDAADGLTLAGIDAIAASYRILEHPPTPVGSGPWRVLSIDPGTTMQLEAFDAFHRGRPVTARVEIRLMRSTAEAIEAVRSDAVHWLLQPFTGGETGVADGIGDASGVVWVDYNVLGYVALHYNLRDGRLFADRNLREALERCVDKDETVAAATGGSGVPIYSPISPSMWAYEPDLPRPTRDVDVARGLIEASGWTLGDDGIYGKGDQRLATAVPVREDREQHVRFVQLLSVQAADCGIEIMPRLMSRDEIILAIEWPLVPPGADQQWDAVFAGWALTPDPDYSAIFHSSEVVTASNPFGFNYVGYSSAEGDSLLDRARATYDPRERARLYQEHQQILAEDRPVLFAWSAQLRDPRTDRLKSTEGPLGTATSTWWWQLETLYVQSPDP